MRKFFKQFAVTAMAGALFFSTPVFNPPVSVRAEIETSDEEEESSSAAAALTSTQITKDLTVDDADSAFVPKVPGVTFNYTIAPETTKLDNGYVKAGVGTPTITNVAFTSADQKTADIDAAAGSYYVRKQITADFAGVTFPAPGIYRYVITETGYTVTDGGAYTEADLKNIDTNNARRYLDVYVAESTTTPGTRTITGFVLKKETNKTTMNKQSGFTHDTETTPDYNETPGEEGYNTDESKEPNTPSSVFRTYDLTVTKKVTGFNADSDNTNYSFTLTLPHARNGAVYGDADNAALTLTNNTVYTATLQKDGSYTFRGLPMSYTATLAEADPGQNYSTPKIAVDAAAASDMTRSTSGSTTTFTASVTSNNTDTDPTDLVVTNNKTTPPPTGLFMMVAPYGAMLLLAGLLGVLFFRKRAVN